MRTIRCRGKSGVQAYGASAPALCGAGHTLNQVFSGIGILFPRNAGRLPPQKKRPDILQFEDAFVSAFGF
jgi:hypothetical protein